MFFVAAVPAEVVQAVVAVAVVLVAAVVVGVVDSSNSQLKV